MSRRAKLLLGMALIPAVCFGAVVLLHICGLVRPFAVPTGAMTPTVSAGDRIVVEGLTFLFRRPRRGDIVVFTTDGVGGLPSAQFYVKRVTGEPGDHLQISAGKLFINSKQVSISNAVGEIAFDLPQPAPPQTDVTVPSGCYFVVGDNSLNSFDSRYWGSVPHGNIVGRVSFCYWPPERIGRVQ